MLFGVSCKKDFKEYNTSNLAVDINMETAFKHIQMGVYNFSGGGDPNSYQLQQNLNSDCFSGYFMSQVSGFYNSNLSYALNTGWNKEPFKVGYLDVMRYVSIIKGLGVDQKYPGIWAIAQIMQVEGMHRVTDIYGPVPYSKVGPLTANATGIPYDSQKDVYNNFFADLDEATAALKTFIAGGKSLPFEFSTMDLIYGSNKSTEFENWLRFANSLRLRLALRIVKIDPVLAKLQGEKALDPANGGVITDNTQIVQVAVPAGNFSNPLAFITINWANICIGSSIQTYMTGYNDPRIGKYMDKSSDPTSADQYKGIRIGANTATVGVGGSSYNNYSTLNYKDGTNPSFTLRTPPVLMTAAEVYFLRAEAALRNWNNVNGTAQSLYEQGIKTSFAQWGVSSSTYLADNTSVPAAYVDPLNTKNNAPSPSAITIKWDEAANAEQKLERIITQKWIANFPEGQEAWSEFRRTGYPKLIPVANNNSGGTISTDIQIRRLPFSQNEYSTNNAEVQKAIQMLTTPADNGGTRLWWDVANKGNF
nr:SusD/RagB family nutrient-binding outer membrane lipoprotein [Pedobacter sp. HMWF019]